MDDTYEKENDNTLKVTTDPGPEVRSYDFGFLKSQRERILAELADVDEKIAQATTLGIVEKPKEVAPTEVKPK